MVQLLEVRYEEHVISSPARICGIFESDRLSIIPMLQEDYGKHSDRNYYIIKVLNTGTGDEIFELNNDRLPIKGRISTEVEKANDMCSILSVVFGKRFQYHGLLKEGNSYYVPSLNNDVIKYRFLTIHNDKERVDRLFEMNWTKIDEILKLLDKKNVDKFTNASHFYNRALINISYDIEVAYIDLIRAIEVLSDDKGAISDAEMNEHEFDGELQQIYDKIKDDIKLAKYFRKYHGSTKKFVNQIFTLTKEDDIWNKNETNCESYSLQFLKTEKSKKDIIRNSYTIRSQYIHGGLSFGYYVLPNLHFLNELLYCQPGYKNSLNRYIKIQGALSFGGIERLVRWTLLKYLLNLPKDAY